MLLMKELKTFKLNPNYLPDEIIYLLGFTKSRPDK